MSTLTETAPKTGASAQAEFDSDKSQVFNNKGAKSNAKESEAVASASERDTKDSKIHDMSKAAETAKSPAKQKNKTVTEKFETWREVITMFGYVVASSMHALAGSSNLKKFLPKSIKSFVDKNAARFSKLLNSANNFIAAVYAWQDNNMLDFLAKITYPLAVPWMNLEDIHLAGGLCAGLTQIENAQTGRVKQLAKDGSKWENIKANCKAFWQMFKENMTGGITKHLKVFLGKDNKGYSMALSGYLISLGSLIGILFGANKRNFWNKLGGVLRNAGGFFGDFTMMLYPEVNNRISGAFYCVNAVIDAIQRFLPDNVIDTVNHFNMILNNIATHYFIKITRAKADKTFTTYEDAGGKYSEKAKAGASK